MSRSKARRSKKQLRKTSVPRSLAAVADDPKFWASYLWEERSSSAFRPCKIELAVAPDASLVIRIFRDIEVVSLLLANGAELAQDSEANGCPDVMRWSEIEIIGRALALRNPKLTHPGLPLRLLARFAPICVGDDFAAIAPMLMSAWRAVGANDEVVRARLEHADRRADGFVWREQRGRWSLDQRLPKGREAVGRAHGTRWSKNVEFPHEQLAAVIAAAQATIDDAIEPAWRRGPPGKRARAAVKKRDFGACDEIADLLEKAGCDAIGLLRALRGAPAERAWALEVLLGEPMGRLVARLLGGDLPQLRPRARLTLTIERPPRPFTVETLSEIKPIVEKLTMTLQAARLGSAQHGGAHSTSGPDGMPMLCATFVAISIRGDLEEAIDLIRKTLSPAPDGATLRVDAPLPRNVPL